MSPPAEPPHPAPGEVQVPELKVPTVAFVRWGMLAWLVVLVVLVLAPGLRSGDRQWWVWVPVAGIAVGALGYAYVRRGAARHERP